MDSSVDPGVLELGGLTFEENGLVATITLNRPETKNSQTPATWHALRIIGASLDPAVRVVVVQAAGDSFSSGLDRRMLSPDGLPGETSVMQLLDMPDPEMAESIATWQEGFTWLRRPEIVTVASVRGAAVGAGFQLALACDLRVLSETARFSMREPLLGLVPDLTGTKPLVDLVGYSRALDICAPPSPNTRRALPVPVRPGHSPISEASSRKRRTCASRSASRCSSRSRRDALCSSALVAVTAP